MRSLSRATGAICDSLEKRMMLSATADITVAGTATHGSAISATTYVGAPFSLDSSQMVQTNKEAITNHYSWNFGDITAGSEYNILPGFNAGHIYNTAGSYQARLTVTATDGTQSVATVNVTVSASPFTKTYYVDNNPALAGAGNNGLSPTTPFSTFATALTTLGTQQHVQILFRQGETFPVSTTGNLQSNFVQLASYWTSDSSTYAPSHDRPLIHWTGTTTGTNILTTQHVDTVVVRDLSFDAVSATTLPQAIYVRSKNLGVINCEFLPGIQNAIKGDDPPAAGWQTGIIIQDNVTPIVGGQVIAKGDVWIEGTDWSILGNYFAGSRDENVLRCDATPTGSKGILIYGNDLDNIAASNKESTIQIRGVASDVYIANNTVRNFNIHIGNSGAAASASAVQRVVVDSNHGIGTDIEVYSASDDIMIRNNVLERIATAENLRPGGAVIIIATAAGEPGDDDLQIINNTGNTTIPDTLSTGPMINFNYAQLCTDVVMDNNLYITPSTRTDPAVRLAGMSSLSLSGVFSEIKDNVWSSFATSTDVIELKVGATTTPWTLATWNSNNPSGSAGNDIVAALTLNEATLYPTTGTVDSYNRNGLALFDYNGFLRYPGTVTAGAVDRHGPLNIMRNIDVGPTGAQLNPGSSVPVTDGRDYNVVGSGTGVGGTSDQFHYVAESRTGDFDVKVQVDSLTNEDNSVLAALMARVDLTDGSINATVRARPLEVPGTTQFTYRTTASGSTTSAGAGTEFAPETYLRLKRAGNLFTGYSSVDGTTWTTLGSATITMPSTVYLGMVVCANTASLATPYTTSFAQFRGFSDVAASAYSSADIGAGITAGYNRQISGDQDFQVGGAGAGVGGTSDQFRFTYKQITGDFDIDTRINWLEPGTGSAVAGLMARASLSAGDANVFSYAAQSTDLDTTHCGISSRLTSGGSTSTTATAGIATFPEIWVRLKRVGNLFTAYQSADGVNWTQTGSSVTVTMSSTIYVGMAVASGNNSVIADADFAAMG